MPRSFRFSHLVAALLVAFLAFGCKKRPPEPAPESPVIPLSVEHTGPPVTEDEARVFGDQLTKAVAAGDRAAINDLLRLKDMLDRSVSDLGFCPRSGKTFSRVLPRGSVTFRPNSSSWFRAVEATPFCASGPRVAGRM